MNSNEEETSGLDNYYRMLRVPDLAVDIAERLNWIEVNSTIAVAPLRDSLVEIFSRAAGDRSYRRRVHDDLALICRLLNDAEYQLIVRHDDDSKALSSLGYAAAYTTEALQK